MASSLRDIDQAALLLEQVRSARDTGRPLHIVGGRSKDFLGRACEGIPLDTRGHCGIVSYDPAELVITARAGTPLADLEAALDAAGQILPCEPPDFTGRATVGGMVATGLSGPRRPWAGSVRDYVLGCRLISGHGNHLRFGGQVIKNVAGYDVSRLLAGSFGCLGLLTEVSLKVLPKPRASLSLRLEIGRSSALRLFTEWGQRSLPISGACHDGHAALIRLEGGTGSVKAAREMLGGEVIDEVFWRDLRDHRLAFFGGQNPLWRLSVASHRTPLELPGEALIDWGGAQVWLKTAASPAEVRSLAAAAGGHATCFTAGLDDSPLMPLPAPLFRYHQQIKAQLDPQGIFNPARMYAGL